MIKVAKEKNPTGKFECKDILEDTIEKYDYVFCIGTMNIGGKGYCEFVKEMIKKMASNAKKGVALSFLSESKYLVKIPYHFEDAIELKKWIEEELELKVKIIDDKRLMGETIMFLFP